MVEARLGRPGHRPLVLAVLLPSRVDAAGSRAGSSTCSQVCVRAVFFLFLFLVISVGGMRADFSLLQRYSKQHKFRPAASPVITERLKDGRVRVRGEAPHRRSL